MRAATIAIVACLACGSPVTPRDPAADERALRRRIAHAEARRAGDIGELITLAREPLALRALGRVGGARARDTLVAALRDDARVVAAAEALGIAASLDEAPPSQAVTDALNAALDRAPMAARPSLIMALGRVGGADVAPRLVAGLAGGADVARASALALGRLGRRKLAIDDDARGALLAALAATDRGVRHAAIWALAREHEPQHLAEAARRHEVGWIARLAHDPDAEIRALAAQAIGKRGLGAWIDPATRAALLGDADWRVAAEAMRAFGGDGAALVARLAAVEREPRDAHVILDGLRAIAGDREAVPRLRELAHRARASKLPALTRGWIVCLADVAIARGVPELVTTNVADVVTRCDHALPEHLRWPLLGELVVASVGTLEARRAAVRLLLQHPDARVRASGVAAAPSLWRESDELARRELAATIARGIAAPEPVIAGTATEAAGNLFTAAGRDPLVEPVVAAVRSRAGRERDPELAGSLRALLQKRGFPAPPPVAAGAPPPVDVATVIGTAPRWRLVTTRGEVVIRLDPAVAPWAVATIVSLTRKGFYDGLEVHRVVPGFVVQGGDPTQSGWGGPGFVLPAEPSGDARYVEGAVGMADAGRDTAGSQWFVMHAAAPHLDARYTWIGEVERGLAAAHALLIGDRVLRATIE